MHDKVRLMTNATCECVCDICRYETVCVCVCAMRAKRKADGGWACSRIVMWASGDCTCTS
ncbi:MAG: hypothetical protein BYD32DRAFT_421298 [Podila humilis]|nr:MAG: hypothetical protein BYD32DRAFT_421298 [Podila humilis]